MDNRDMAERRLVSLNRRLQKDRSLRERYDSVSEGYENEGSI